MNKNRKQQRERERRLNPSLFKRQPPRRKRAKVACGTYRKAQEKLEQQLAA